MRGGDHRTHPGAAQSTIWVGLVGPGHNITTIGEIEKTTGINFLPGVSASKRAEMENFKAPALWPKE